jgi:hypothetical protein
METDDPRAALEATDVTTRSAAARDLALVGTWTDLAELVRHASEDKSAAVRLYAASAAADIVARHRGAAGQAALDDAQRAQVHAWVRAIDPGTNPGLLMMLSAVPDEASIERLGRMLRDPRNGVRAGAAMAIRRMALSGAAIRFDALKSAFDAWLASGKLPLDATLELIKLIGELGWRGFEQKLRPLNALGKLHAAAIEEVGARLKLRDDPAAWEGVWITEGLDVLEIPGAKAPPRDWIAIRDGVWARPGGEEARIEYDHGLATVDGEPVRMIWAPRVGQPDVRVAAVQRAGRTFWKAEGKDLAGMVDEWFDRFVPEDRATMAAIARWLATVDGTLATRARAIVAWKSGATADAIAILEELAGHKKPRPDVYYWLGVVYAEAGRKADAKAALDGFIDKAAKKAEFRKEAEELRAKLG